MKFQNTVSIPVVLKSKPYEKPWSSVDKKTGEARSGSVHVVKGTMIPELSNVEPNALQEIEFNINTSKRGSTKKNLSDILELYFDNREKFLNGEVYARVETYMGPRRNNGVVTFFSPWINDIEVVTPNEEDLKLVKTALLEEAPAELAM